VTIIPRRGASVMVTDDYVARNRVAAFRVSEKCFYSVLTKFPSITGPLILQRLARIRLNIPYLQLADLSSPERKK